MKSSRVDEARFAWAATIPLGANRAEFASGELIRCPATRRLTSGARVVCGWTDGAHVGPETFVEVLVDRRQSRRAGALNTHRRCPSCGAHLELFYAGVRAAS